MVHFRKQVPYEQENPKCSDNKFLGRIIMLTTLILTSNLFIKEAKETKFRKLLKKKKQMPIKEPYLKGTI